MRQLEDHVDLDALLELRPPEVGEFCEGALDEDILIEELEEYGPFAPFRKNFCDFLGIGESTLTGWLKGGRVPRMAKVAYVMLVGLSKLQAEVKRLREDVRDLKIVRDGKHFQVVQFEVDETGVPIGTIIARDIPSAKTARVFAGSVKGFRMLDEARHLIVEMLGRTENDQYIEYLNDFDTRIIKESVAAFDAGKWKLLFGSIDFDSDNFSDEMDRQRNTRDSYEPNMILAVEPKTSSQESAGTSNKGK